MDALKWYIDNRLIYKRLSKKIESILTEILEMEKIPYHMIQSRTKDIDSFKNKISGDKYIDPINEIQDFSGIRIITYVEDEISQVCDIIEKIFKIDKNNSLDKSEALGIDKVGYKSVHYVAYLKHDRLKLPENTQFKDKCFEIQVRTILQHAWAEIEHDRNYKFSGILPKHINRRFKLLSGSLEIADSQFNNIAKEIDAITNQVKNKTLKGNFDIKLNTISFSEYFKNRFSKIIQEFIVTDLSDKEIINELNLCEIYNIKDFENIIPKDFENQLIHDYKGENEIWARAIIRLILIINDYDVYFKNIKPNWKVWSSKGNGKNIFDYYNIDWEIIKEKYNKGFSD